jgi:DNA-binding GntR family transcriptional regulator
MVRSVEALPYADLPTLTIEALDDRVSQILRDAIVSGSLAPGQRLVEARLAQRLGVSRAPVREALAVLEREGLVSSLPTRGLVVTLLTTKDVREIYGLRTALECWAVREVCRVLTNAQLEHLASVVERMEQSSLDTDTELLTREDVEFHRLIIEIAGNERLLQMYLTIRSQIRLLSRQVVTTLYSDLRQIPSRHRAILDVLRTRDAGRAEACVRSHISLVADIMIAAFPERA